MIRCTRLEHRFVKHIPERLEPGVLYVSMEYATAAHSCCCGCGEEVVTPFTPTDWKMTFDGETISLVAVDRQLDLALPLTLRDRPRAGPRGRPWSDAQIAAERRRDKAAKERYYEAPQRAPPRASSGHDAPGDGTGRLVVPASATTFRSAGLVMMYPTQADRNLRAPVTASRCRSMT